MTEKLYKAVQPDGTDFHTGKIDYLVSDVITHPKASAPNTSRTDAAYYLSVSTSKTDCTGFSWPARLLEVEAVGEVWTPHSDNMPNKRAVVALRVVRELPAIELLGPQAEGLLAIVARCRALTYEEAHKLDAVWDAVWGAAWGAVWDAAWGAAWGAARGAVWDAAWGAAWGAARDAARGAARGAVWDAVHRAAWDAVWGAARGVARGAVWDAARDAARALLSRDLIGPSGFTQERYDLLSGPWRRTIGRIHPDDADLMVNSTADRAS